MSIATQDTPDVFEAARQLSERRKELEARRTELEAKLDAQPTQKQRAEALAQGQPEPPGFLDDSAIAATREAIQVIDVALERIKHEQSDAADRVRTHIRREAAADHAAKVAALRAALDSVGDCVGDLKQFEGLVRDSDPHRPEPGPPWVAWRSKKALEHVRQWQDQLKGGNQ